MPKGLIWGASGHALVVAGIVRQTERFEIVGFIDDVNTERAGSEFCGAQIIGERDELKLFHDQGVRELVVAVGDPSDRLELARFAESVGFELVAAVHPAATVAPGVAIGRGTVVMAGAVVNPGCQVGSNSVVNSGATVDHECKLAEGATICPGAHLGGNVHVGRAAWIGIGAVVCEKVRIGEESVIGAGAVVVKDIPSRVLAYGSPARVIRIINE